MDNWGFYVHPTYCGAPMSLPLEKTLVTFGANPRISRQLRPPKKATRWALGVFNVISEIDEPTQTNYKMNRAAIGFVENRSKK